MVSWFMAGFCLAITTPLNLSNLEPMYPRWLSVGRKIRKKIDPKKGGGGVLEEEGEEAAAQ